MLKYSLLKKITNIHFSMQLDESTVRDSEALLIGLCKIMLIMEKCIEDMLFCEALETTTIAIDIYKKFKTDDKQLPLDNIIYCATDSAPVLSVERLFIHFCKDQNADYVKLFLHTDVKWLSEGNFLQRFMELFDIFSKFLDDTPYMTLLLTVDGKALVSNHGISRRTFRITKS